MLSAKLGHILDKPLEPIAKRITIHPNVITIIGLIITVVACAVIPFHLAVGGLLIILGGFFDMLDGVVARANSRNTKFGAFLDSTIDRYSDSLIFIAIAWYFFNEGNLHGVLLTAGAMVGALLISYVRARAEGLGIECKVGLMERPERIVLLAFGCISGLILYVVTLIFVLNHLTVVQRIIHVYKSDVCYNGSSAKFNKKGD
ncbi:MAG: CDP-alcohol phosphatidyltransferase family protein [Thermodesulfovibrionales bacterium]